MDLLTALTSPIQNMRQMPKAIIMIALEEVAKNIALGTCLRGFLVSSTDYLVSIALQPFHGLALAYSYGEHHQSY